MSRLDVDAPFALWSVDLSAEPGRREVTTLSVPERARARRFRFRRDRRRYIVAHAALRRLLVEHGVPAGQNAGYVVNRFGKPRLDDLSKLGFSLSYAGDTALVGLTAAGEIGVDIEALRPIDGGDVTDDIFDATERAAITATGNGPARDLAFLRAWTRKEACVKAAGSGLSTPPSDVSVGVGTDVRRLALTGERGRMSVEVGSFRMGDGSVAAWARVL